MHSAACISIDFEKSKGLLERVDFLNFQKASNYASVKRGASRGVVARSR
jgi:hypothetical protein